MVHKKPTQEDLEISLRKTEDELEIIEKEEGKKVEEVKKKVEEMEKSKEEEEIEEVKEDPVKKIPEEKVEEKEEEKEPDYKEKFSESSREAQKIHAKNRKLNEGLSKASEINEATEEEMIEEYPDWDVMSDTEKKLARKNFINDKRFAVVTQATEEAKKIEKWGDDVDTFVEDSKTLVDNPELEGKIEEFKVFANEISNHAIPFKILVSAFLHDISTKKVKNKGKMMEVGSGGPNEKLKTKGDKISLDEAAKLMKTDYKKYKELLLSGKIDSTIE
ncbi:MAG: hypothetical protein UT62_C0008G0008 [Parcubacteria group bacterium GW2011_GWC1_39_8]|nr:MAG: hypothetical protein UT62_C0008G0008 [Parcubacteria group bacterium GW2011_GWC1_39_8]